MAHQLPKEVMEIALGAGRMMLEDGITPEMFIEDIERLTRVYVEAYVERQRRMCMTFLTCESTRADAMDALIKMLRAKK